AWVRSEGLGGQIIPDRVGGEYVRCRVFGVASADQGCIAAARVGHVEDPDGADRYPARLKGDRGALGRAGRDAEAEAAGNAAWCVLELERLVRPVVLVQDDANQPGRV